MPRLRTPLLFFGLSCYLAVVGFSLAGGLVFCIEQDGQMKLEASADGVSCHVPVTTTAMVSPEASLTVPPAAHCDDCQDHPPQLAEAVGLRTGGFAAVSPALPASTGPWVLASSRVYPGSLLAPSARSQRVVVQRSTILRI